MKRTLLASVLAAVALMVWGMVSWTVLPWHLATIHTIPDGEAVVSALSERVNESGVYHFPGVDGTAEMSEKAWVARYRDGPNIHFLAYSKQGTEPFSPGGFLRAFLLNLVAAFLAATLLVRAAPSLPRFGDRVMFVALLGGFAGVATRLVDWNWWSFSLDYSLVMAVDLVIGWALAGVVLARFARPIWMDG